MVVYIFSAQQTLGIMSFNEVCLLQCSRPFCGCIVTSIILPIVQAVVLAISLVNNTSSANE